MDSNLLPTNMMIKGEWSLMERFIIATDDDRRRHTSLFHRHCHIISARWCSLSKQKDESLDLMTSNMVSILNVIASQSIGLPSNAQPSPFLWLLKGRFIPHLAIRSILTISNIPYYSKQMPQEWDKTDGSRILQSIQREKSLRRGGRIFITHIW